MSAEGLFPAPDRAGVTAAPGNSVLSDAGLQITSRAEERFWKQVVRGPDSRCWIWCGAISSPDGYGRFTWQVDGRRRTVSAHRVALMIAHGGELPPGLVGEHFCCEPLCVRVGEEHVRMTSQATNLARAVSLGRHVSNREVVASYDRAQRSCRVREAVINGWDDTALHQAQGVALAPEEQPGLW